MSEPELWGEVERLRTENATLRGCGHQAELERDAYRRIVLSLTKKQVSFTREELQEMERTGVTLEPIYLAIDEKLAKLRIS